MSAKRLIVAALLRVYPATWRDEYGSELEDLLLARPLGARIAADVLASGLNERVRAAHPAALCGVTMLIVIAHGLAANVAGFEWAAVLQESAKTLPTVVVKPLGSELYVLLLAGCGYAVVAWRGGTVPQAGLAAMKVSLLAGLPVIVAGVAMLVGVLDVIVLAPGMAPGAEQSFAYTYYDALRKAPAPLAVIAAPFFALPQSWLWGMVGGALGRRQAARGSPAAR